MRPYFPDINVWIGPDSPGHQHHASAAGWFEQLSNDRAGFCRFTQLGFLRLLTHTSVMSDEVKTPLEAWKAYDLLRGDPRVAFWPEPDPDDVCQEFRALAMATRFSPQQCMDAYLAAFAKVSGLTLITFDRALGKLATNNVLVLR